MERAISVLRRREIVDATIRVMARNGWAETSIDEITREAGVSRGLLAHHFRGKADLLAGVLARCEENHRIVLAEAFARTHDPVQQLRLVIRAALELVPDDPAVYEVFLHFVANGRTQPELARQVRDLYRGFRASASTAIQHGQRAGAFNPALDPDAAATVMVASLTGLAMQYLLDPTGFPFAEAARQTEEMLVGYATGGRAILAPRVREVAAALV